eukprot:COSAG01_NODE_67310_length_267_cov_0.928571_1_plen_34_part_10
MEYSYRTEPYGTWERSGVGVVAVEQHRVATPLMR